MKRVSRENWLLIAMGVLLVALTIFAAFQRAQEGQPQVLPPLSAGYTGPDGTRALWLWLEALGYTPSDATTASFAVPDDADVVLLLEPLQLISSDEWGVLDVWVEAGGTLVLAGDGWASSSAMRHFDVKTHSLDWPKHDNPAMLSPQTPLWVSPPFEEPAALYLTDYLEPQRDDWVTHFATDGHLVVISFAVGEGQVLLSASTYPFTNEGITEYDNPALVMNMLTASGSVDVIWFDEWHHGKRPSSTAAAGPQDWLRAMPAGHALLYTAVVIFVVLILRGRRFGRPVPLLQHLSRRAPLEYISAIANLRRRAGRRSAELAYYHNLLKRELGKRYRLNPKISDKLYVEQLVQCDLNLDAAALLELLKKLSRSQVSESEMVQLAGEVAKLLKE